MISSIVPSGYFGTDSENIHIIENFLDKELCHKIYAFCLQKRLWEQTSKEQLEFWDDKVLGISKYKDRLPFYNDIDSKFNELGSLIEDTFNVKEIKRDYAVNVVKWPVGPGQEVHGDRENADGSLQYERIRDYDLSSIIYINDNFEGGELHFPQHNIVIKPKVGMAVFFPGDKYYLHGVKEITKGTRFTMPRFWAVKDL